MNEISMKQKQCKSRKVVILLRSAGWYDNAMHLIKLLNKDKTIAVAGLPKFCDFEISRFLDFAQTVR